jgi:response regulator RpfG family c-di-GMP phosphodiesterase
MAILIVDDNRTNLILQAALAEAASTLPVVCMDDPIEALYWCESNTPDLVLVDYRMPHVSGTEFIALFRAIPGQAEIPIIMITTENQHSVREQALSLGATEFLARPVDSVEFRLRVRNLLALRQAQVLLADRAKLLQHEVRLATEAVLGRERELIMRLARAAEFRDPETGAHIVRMARYAALIARQLALSVQFQTMLLEAAPMHDVGKLATPDHILLKPGRLDPEEMAIMRRHAEHGADILAGSSSPLIQMAEQIARAHHEKFDGSGYPSGLRGEAIPLAARIVAVADVFDALTSQRPYKQPWSVDDARTFMLEQRGKHFCPRCVDAFFFCWDEVLTIRDDLPDQHDQHNQDAHVYLADHP